MKKFSAVGRILCLLLSCRPKNQIGKFTVWKVHE